MNQELRTHPANYAPEGKPKFAAALALEVARSLCAALAEGVRRLAVAGSLRRGKALVGDVEILYIPKVVEYRDGLLLDGLNLKHCNLAEETLAGLERAGVLERRRNRNGSECYGPKNKLMRHVQTGLPVDLFAATPENWFNYLVCRTGPVALNTRIAMRAIGKGWQWNPYGAGFSRGGPLAGEEHPVASEAEVFEFVGLPFQPPAERI